MIMSILVTIVLNTVLITGRTLHEKSFLEIDFLLGLILVNITSTLFTLALNKKKAWPIQRREIITIGCSLVAFITYRQLVQGLSLQSLITFSTVLFVVTGVLYTMLLLCKSFYHRITYRSNTYGRDALPH